MRRILYLSLLFAVALASCDYYSNDNQVYKIEIVVDIPDSLENDSDKIILESIDILEKRFKHADIALYSAKDNGRNCSDIYKKQI